MGGSWVVICVVGSRATRAEFIHTHTHKHNQMNKNLKSIDRLAPSQTSKTISCDAPPQNLHKHLRVHKVCIIYSYSPETFRVSRQSIREV